MICPECNGNGYTYDNPEDMELQSSGIGHKTWRCWKCNGTGELSDMITIDKEALATKLANERVESLSYTKGIKYYSPESEMSKEFYAKFIKMIEEVKDDDM